MTEAAEPVWRQRGEPDPVDVHVGNRIRMRRILLGKSQEVVAAHLGVSFQQLQKYESGANRVSASRLFDLAHILMSPISYFFDDISRDLPISQDENIAGDGPAESVLNNRMTLDLIRDFYRITSPQQQRCLLELVRTMADASEEQAAASPDHQIVAPVRMMNSRERRQTFARQRLEAANKAS